MAAGSLPARPPTADSSLTWCPCVHDGKHINSDGSSIEHWKCTETIGHRVFLQRNQEKKGNISWVFHQISVSMSQREENTCSQASARQVKPSERCWGKDVDPCGSTWTPNAGLGQHQQSGEAQHWSWAPWVYSFTSAADLLALILAPGGGKLLPVSVFLHRGLFWLPHRAFYLKLAHGCALLSSAELRGGHRRQAATMASCLCCSQADGAAEMHRAKRGKSLCEERALALWQAPCGWEEPGETKGWLVRFCFLLPRATKGSGE